MFSTDSRFEHEERQRRMSLPASERENFPGIAAQKGKGRGVKALRLPVKMPTTLPNIHARGSSTARSYKEHLQRSVRRDSGRRDSWVHGIVAGGLGVVPTDVPSPTTGPLLTAESVSVPAHGISAFAKAERFEKGTDFAPGPGKYNIEQSMHAVVKHSPAYGFASTSHESGHARFVRDAQQMAGPADYTPANLGPRSPRAMFSRGRRDSTKVYLGPELDRSCAPADTPGPQSYEYHGGEISYKFRKTVRPRPRAQSLAPRPPKKPIKGVRNSRHTYLYAHLSKQYLGNGVMGPVRLEWSDHDSPGPSAYMPQGSFQVHSFNKRAQKAIARRQQSLDSPRRPLTSRV